MECATASTAATMAVATASRSGHGSHSAHRLHSERSSRNARRHRSAGNRRQLLAKARLATVRQVVAAKCRLATVATPEAHSLPVRAARSATARAAHARRSICLLRQLRRARLEEGAADRQRRLRAPLSPQPHATTPRSAIRCRCASRHHRLLHHRLEARHVEARSVEAQQEAARSAEARQEAATLVVARLAVADRQGFIPKYNSNI